MNSVPDYGEEYYKRDEFGFSNTDRSDHKRILELCRFKEQDRVLDIGCGYGVLHKKIPSSFKIGIESNDYVLKICRAAGLEVIFYRDIEESLCLHSSRFDYVILNELLEHVHKPANVLAEAHRVLRKGGSLVVTTPARSLLVRNLDPTHFSEMTVSQLRTLVKSCNFRIVRHEVCGISLVEFLLRKVVYPAGRLIRACSREKRNRFVDSVQNRCQTTSLLKPLAVFRNGPLWLGTVQLLIGQK